MKKYLFVLMGFCFFAVGCEKPQDKQSLEAVQPAAEQQVQAAPTGDPDALYRSGQEKLDAKDFAAAIEDMTKSLQLKESNFVRGDLGRAKESAGDFEGAIAEYTKAIEQNKRSVYYEWRARTYLRLGKEDEAKKDIEEAAKLPKE